MLKNLFQKFLEAFKKIFLFAWEKFKVFWFNVAVPGLKGLTPKKALAILVILLVAGALILALMFYVLSFDLPTIESLKDYKPSAGTTILAEDGRVLGQIRIEKGIYVPIQRIPKHMINALLATEDPRFYQHKGIDYRGIMRAAYEGHHFREAEAGRQHHHPAVDQGGVPFPGEEIVAEDQGNYSRAPDREGAHER